VEWGLESSLSHILMTGLGEERRGGPFREWTSPTSHGAGGSVFGIRMCLYGLWDRCSALLPRHGTPATFLLGSLSSLSTCPSSVTDDHSACSLYAKRPSVTESRRMVPIFASREDCLSVAGGTQCLLSSMVSSRFVGSFSVQLSSALMLGWLPPSTLQHFSSLYHKRSTFVFQDSNVGQSQPRISAD